MATICQLHADLRYYLCLEPVDMRKQFQGLQGMVNAEFGRYLAQDEAYIFVGKSRTMVKILHREHGGLKCTRCSGPAKCSFFNDNIDNGNNGHTATCGVLRGCGSCCLCCHCCR